MSSFVSIYAVSLDELNNRVGSRDQALIDRICFASTVDFASIDELDEDAEITCAEAVARIIRGQGTEDAEEYHLGSLYGYALESICSVLGKDVGSIDSISRAIRWMEEVDKEAQRVGIPLRLIDLTCSGSPIDIPPADDWPSIGFWTPEQIAAGQQAFATLDTTQVNPEFVEIFEDMQGWLEKARTIPGASIIGFLS